MSQIKKKFIEANSVDGTKIQLANQEMLRGRNAANTADVNILQVNSTDKPEFQTLPQVQAALAVPSALKQLATIEYVQNYVLGKTDAKDAVSYLADVNVPLTGSTPLIIDGGTITDQQYVILTAQTAGAANGIYTVTITGATYSMARRPDAATSAQVTEGLYTFVTQGTNYQGYEALLTTADPIVLGTTLLVFARFPSTISLVGGDMITKTGNIFSLDIAPLGGLESTNAGNVAGQVRVKIDQATLEKDQTTRRDPTTGAVAAKKAKKAFFTLSATDISNQYVDLADVAGDSSIDFKVAGAGSQLETNDYTVNYTGGTSSKTRVTFTGGLASAGVSALASGDQLVIAYLAF